MSAGKRCPWEGVRRTILPAWKAMDRAKTSSSSFLLLACFKTSTENSPLAIRSMWFEERLIGMAMLRVAKTEKKMPIEMVARTR